MAAELILRARKDTVRHFRDLGATNAERAVTYQPQRHLERRALGYLAGKGVVKLADSGRYWLDEEAASAWKRETATRTALIAGGAAAAVAGIFLWRRYRNTKS